ncbi:hypothetical protein H6P81_003660 [Aristolochia fimbriata]|uniref:Glutaredoxin domain-containing protein n=1 Tax=Aristolochia fimbriata TaxID=158543 RepID=A0AAV7FH47_ARIFI|nr:hypothetical protein H6P81_003660 [Aristolochia fimbriata]
MGCVSSKFARGDLNEDVLLTARNGDFPNHIVSLTSTTYGVLNLDPEPPRRSTPRRSADLGKRFFDGPEIINTWELMHDLDEEIPVVTLPSKRSPRSEEGRQERQGGKFSKSPKQRKKFAGKENIKQEKCGSLEDAWGRAVLKPFCSLENLQVSSSPASRIKLKTSPVGLKLQCASKDSGFFSVSQKSFSPFDPELVASFEKEHYEEKEQIKKIISPLPRRRRSPQSSDDVLESFEMKRPPGGENSVIIYTTTLRGIRKTFEDCNRVRSAIEAYDVRMIERDVSMHSGFKDELRVLMGGKSTRVPLVFVKGRLIGGAEEVIKLEEEGSLKLLFEGIPPALEWCKGCGGVRFVMCMDCSGSCKILDKVGTQTVRCGRCNENGLIQCPVCC